MKSLSAVLVSAALAAAVAQSPSPQVGCVYNPMPSNSQAVSYNLQFFADNSPYLLIDDRNFLDPFLYQVSWCGNVPPEAIADPFDCFQTRGMTSQTACSTPTYRPSAAYQFYASGVSPTPTPAAVASEETKGTDSLFAAKLDPFQGRQVTGIERDMVIAAARRTLGKGKISFAKMASYQQREGLALIDKALKKASFPQSAAPLDPLTEMAEVGALQPCSADRCWRVAGDITQPANIQYGPLFPGIVIGSTNTASGFSVVYSNGDTCFDASGAKPGVFPRQIRFHMVCSPEVGSLNTDVIVVESSLCTYDVGIRSVHGCPSQCQSNVLGDQLCSGNGICGWDSTNSVAKCFCYTGSSGQLCTQSGDLGTPHATGHPDMIVGGLFGGIFGGLIIGAGLFYYFVYMRPSHGAPSFSRAPAPAAASSSSSRVGGIRAMFGGSSSSYAPPTLTSGAIPGIDDEGSRYAPASSGDEDADNPML